KDDGLTAIRVERYDPASTDLAPRSGRRRQREHGGHVRRDVGVAAGGVVVIDERPLVDAGTRLQADDLAHVEGRAAAYGDDELGARLAIGEHALDYIFLDGIGIDAVEDRDVDSRLAKRLFDGRHEPGRHDPPVGHDERLRRADTLRLVARFARR